MKGENINMCTNKDKFSSKARTGLNSVVENTELFLTADKAIKRLNILIDSFHMTLQCEDADHDSNVSNAEKLVIMTDCFFKSIQNDLECWQNKYGYYSDEV